MASELISESLTQMFNTSLRTGEVPTDWLLSKITPVYKGKGDKSVKLNYRPIAVVCHIAKIIEKVVNSQFLSYLLNHNFITIDQHAFLLNHSTNTCIHQVADDWLEAFNEHEMVAACFLDISKCFDCIDHEFLLFKLTKYGVSDNELKWFTNYLSGRKQVVSCNGVLSDKREMKIGVPQGSTLGPTLFLVFINDIITSLKSARCCIFADDVVLYVSHKNLDLATVTLQNSLNELYKWYKNNRLKINVDKTKVMLLKSSSSDKLNIFIENHQIEQVKSIRYLGVEVDENLSWKQHIDKLCKSLSFKIHFLGLLRKYLDARLLNILYKTIIQSCTDYCCSVWGNCCISYKSGLVRLQKRAARFVTGNFDFLTTHGLDLMKELSWQSLEQRRDYFFGHLDV